MSLGFLAEEDTHAVLRSGNVIVNAWVKDVPIEESVWQQVENIAAVPGVERIAIMPDAHLGNGACVGSAILTRDIVIPAAIGVDIGCGMVAVPTNLHLSDVQEHLVDVRREIEKRIPHGRTDNGGKNDRGAWGVSWPDAVAEVWDKVLDDGYQTMLDTSEQLAFPRVINQLGTLGTGNHFVEIQQEVDCPQANNYPATDSPIWIMLHSGSRGVGNHIGTWFTKQARRQMDRWHIDLPDKELGFLPIDTDLGKAYLQASKWAQEYAMVSRNIMLGATLQALQAVISSAVMYDEDEVHIHHNYITNERHFGRNGWVMRKGAINADRGRVGIIPSSMGGISYITCGLGNPESLNTSSHGAGRTMSRTAIKKQVSFEQFLEEVKGVECRTDYDPPIDETPSAYKQIDAVMKAQKDLTEPLVALKALVCVKG